MKRECPSLFAALLVSLLVNVLLRSQTAYRPRAGLAAAPLCALLLAAVGWLFARCWRLACDPVLRLLFGTLLVFSSVLELLRLWQLADRLYPGAITLTSVCLLAVLPVVYLRRVSALSQTARAVLCLLAAATAVMLISVLPRLRITNLQYTVLTRADFFTAAKDQLTLYPEYLLPALWPAQDKRGRHTLLRLAGYALAAVHPVGHGSHRQAGTLSLCAGAAAGRPKQGGEQCRRAGPISCVSGRHLAALRRAAQD